MFSCVFFYYESIQLDIWFMWTQWILCGYLLRFKTCWWAKDTTDFKSFRVIFCVRDNTRKAESRHLKFQNAETWFFTSYCSSVQDCCSIFEQFPHIHIWVHDYIWHFRLRSLYSTTFMSAEISFSVHCLDCYNILMTRPIFIIYHVANTAPRHDNFEKICYVADYSVWNMKCTNIFLGEIHRYVNLYALSHL
jgi:hypothetical protein